VDLRADLDRTEHVDHTGMGSPNRPAVASRYTNYAIQLSNRECSHKGQKFCITSILESAKLSCVMIASHYAAHDSRSPKADVR